MILHHYWRSSASYRVRIALNLKGLSADFVSVDLVAGEQGGSAYREKNPQGLVPLLEDGPLRINQSLAIIDYLEAVHPEPAVFPSAPSERARALSMAYAIAMEIHPLCNLSVLKRIEALGGADARLQWNREAITKGLDSLEKSLPDSGFCVGSRPSIADICLVPQLYNARRWELDLDRWPQAMRIEAVCLALPAFAAAHPERHKPA